MTTSPERRRLRTPPVLEARLITVLRARLPDVAEHTIAAVVADVPSYAGAFGGPMGETIERAVEMALDGFLTLAERGDAGSPLSGGLDGAFRLGQGEARQGRSIDALLAAYRVGARAAWRELAATAVAHDLPADAVAGFAELVFAYIDELSAASVSGHTAQTEATSRRRERDLDRLAQALLRGDPVATLLGAAVRAEWAPPTTLTVAVLPEALVRGALAAVPAATLVTTEAPGLAADLAVLLLPDVGAAGRRRLIRELAGRSAVVGPARPWASARASYLRAQRALALREGTTTLDTEDHLATLVLEADPEARADLRARTLAPLAGERPGSAEKLTETLRAWLLHQGRREEVARALFVHPQTVRYRMSRLRELYGDALDDPGTVLDLTLALAEPAALGAGRPERT